MLHDVHMHASPMQALIEWFRRRQAASELARLDAEETARIADDLKVSVDDLHAVVAQSPDEDALMTRMMALHGLNRARLESEMPAVVRDMAVTCAKCGCKGECAYDLDHGALASDCDAYCGNADTMQALAKGTA
ncbi:MAG: hypothetical protein ACRCXM_10405 [Beijerinckiaceae bacterium]